MVPSSVALIESIRQGLEQQVAPTVTDKVALSVLRSIDALLAHLAVRVEGEAGRLAADNADLREVLGLVAVDEAGPSVAELSARHASLLAVVDEALAAALASDDSVRLAEIDAYLARRLERETPLIFPAFAGRTY